MIMPEFDYINVGALTPAGEERFGLKLDPKTKFLVWVGDKTIKVEA